MRVKLQVTVARWVFKKEVQYMTMYGGKVSLVDLKDPVFKDCITKELINISRSEVAPFFKKLFDDTNFSSDILAHHLPEIFISNRVIKRKSGTYSFEELCKELDELLDHLKKLGMLDLAGLLEDIYNNITRIEENRNRLLDCEESIYIAECPYEELENITVDLFNELDRRIGNGDIGDKETDKAIKRIKDFVRHLKNRKSVSLKLGSYIPENNLIILYVNAIYGSFSPVLKSRTYSEFIECLKIVYIHELTHAVHYLNMDTWFWNMQTRPREKRRTVIEALASFAEYYWCYELNRRNFAPALSSMGKWKCDKLMYMYIAFDYPECPYAAARIFIFKDQPDLDLFRRIYFETICPRPLTPWRNAYNLIKKSDYRSFIYDC